ADTTYSQSKVIFSATAVQEGRELTAGGDVILHPDHQEIHLPALVLRTPTQEWALAPGDAPTIAYGNEQVTVENLALANGNQRITAEGTLGKPGEALVVTVENVDVSQLNQLMLRDPEQISGLLSARAMISGAVSGPAVKADFAIEPGAFEQVTFESLGGHVDYSAS